MWDIADDIYKDIAEDVEIRFDTLHFELDRPLPKGKTKNIIGLMKDEIGAIITKKFVQLIGKIHSYLIDDGSVVVKIKK